MATTAIAAQSYPAYGEGGLSVSQWAEMFGSPDAIIEDNTGTAFALSRIDASNTVRIGAAGNLVKVNGYVMKLAGPTDFAWPTPTSTTVLLVAAMYDPALNVALTGGESADPQGPVRLIFTTDALDPAKGYTPLFQITRTAGQALSQAVVVDLRTWHGPQVELAGMPATGRPTMPRGSTVYDSKSRCDWARVLNSGGTALEWVNLDAPDATPFAATSGLVARDSVAELYSFARCMRGLRGTLKRSSGSNLSNGNDVTLGTVPVGSRPGATERFDCKIQGTSGSTEVRVQKTGEVIMLDPPSATQWIDLSVIKYRAEN